MALAKIGSLLIKTISKPVSKILKDKAKESETFKKWFVIPTANIYHSLDITIRMKLLGLGSPDKVLPLTEKAAIELGGDILSDLFVFGTACGLILLEYARQSWNAERKAIAFDEKVHSLESNLNILKQKLDESNKQVEEIITFSNTQTAEIEQLEKKINPKKHFLSLSRLLTTEKTH